MKEGDVITDLGGPLRLTQAGLLARQPGEKRHLVLSRGGSTLAVDVLAEELLAAS